VLTTAARPSASQLQTTCDTPASQFVCASYLDDICPCLPVWPCTRNCANKTVRKRQTVWDFWDFTPKLDVILLKFESAPSLEESPPGAQTLSAWLAPFRAHFRLSLCHCERVFLDRDGAILHWKVCRLSKQDKRTQEQKLVLQYISAAFRQTDCMIYIFSSISVICTTPLNALQKTAK